MAFPTSPSNEDYYNGYLYNSIKGAWTTEDGEWHTVGEAGNPPFQNGWSIQSNQVKLKFRKTSRGTVEIAGGAFSGTSSGIFVLPIGFRPGTSVYFSASAYTGSGHIMKEASVGPNGSVSVSHTGIDDIKLWIEFEIGII